jgi:hypothetical protein
MRSSLTVIPAEAGIRIEGGAARSAWIPAFLAIRESQLRQQPRLSPLPTQHVEFGDFSLASPGK